ncbi:MULTISPECIES: hypothetical protein [Allobacillus]|uniref:Uncharacterized protein n=1 Tax=Allobacillus halotolerans TaxID=570278 RepID=A0ABS6GTK6_9BACI|nr:MULTISPECIES: hypothetical protein [Allobacillus]MBU6081860.1 hypothetical protein [Allobacillus halotolerans]TSJ65291.1 hypothetical protein FPQ10_10040 [Allobacillus sp. SKP2-8]
MKRSTKWSLRIAIFVLVFFPIFFIIFSYTTDNWNFLWYSLIPTFFSGSLGLFAALNQAKKDRMIIEE